MIGITQLATLALLCLSQSKPNYRQDNIRQSQVTFAIYGVSGMSTILPPIQVDITEGETVLDVSVRTLKKERIQFEAAGVGIGTYIRAIDNLYQFDQGPQSGWLYKVNGKFPSEGSGGYVLTNGDTVEWVYTANLGKDVGADINNLSRQNNYMPQNTTMRKTYGR